MPADMTKYPPNWKTEIRPSILRRAGGSDDDPRVGACCEWCGVRNYAVGYRDDDGAFQPLSDGWDDTLAYKGRDPDTDDYSGMSYAAAKIYADVSNGLEGATPKAIVIVLTIAHVDDPDPMNCDPANLAALCQRCHLTHDARLHATNAAETRRQKQLAAGQMELF